MKKKIKMRVSHKNGAIILNKGGVYECERVDGEYFVIAGMWRVNVPRYMFDVAK